MSSENGTNILKLPPLIKPSDYIHWKRRLYAFLRKDDAELVGLSDQPEAVTQAVMRTWKKLSTKAKSHLVLSLRPNAISQTRRIIDDDDKSAKDLWDELNRIYTTTSGQAVQNLRQKLDSLVFEDNKSWIEHVSSFLRICEELATYDVELTETEKTSKLIRSLPSSFSPLAMVSTMTTTTFEKVVSAVEAEISRRSNPKNPQRDSKPQVEKSANQASRGGRRRGRGGFGRGFRGRRGGYYRGRGGRSGQRDRFPVCHYCGKPGHFINVCRTRIADENSGRVHKPQRGGHSGYRARGRGQHNGSQRGNESSHNPFHYQVPRYNPYNNWNQVDTQDATQDGNNIQGANAARRLSFDQPQECFHANMAVAKVKTRFASSVATLGQHKSPNMLIDSGGTHNFFHSLSSFSNYERIETEMVQAAFNKTKIIGKGLVWIPLNGGMQMIAYHTPQFQSNILSVSELSDHFDVLFSSKFKPMKDCFIFKQGTQDVIFETPCQDGL